MQHSTWYPTRQLLSRGIYTFSNCEICPGRNPDMLPSLADQLTSPRHAFAATSHAVLSKSSDKIWHISQGQTCVQLAAKLNDSGAWKGCIRARLRDMTRHGGMHHIDGKMNSSIFPYRWKNEYSSFATYYTSYAIVQLLSVALLQHLSFMDVRQLFRQHWTSILPFYRWSNHGPEVKWLVQGHSVSYTAGIKTQIAWLPALWSNH